jgi:hypothetical protein
MMIIDALLSVLAGVIHGFLALLPNYTPDTSALVTSGASVGSWASILNGYVPVQLLGWCLVFLLGIKVVLVAWDGILFVYHQIWGSS